MTRRCLVRYANRSRAVAHPKPSTTITTTFAASDIHPAPGNSTQTTMTARAGAAINTSSGSRASQYNSPAARPVSTMPTQSGPHAATSLHDGSGSTAIAHTTLSNNARTGHSRRRAHGTGRACIHSAASTDSHRRERRPAGEERVCGTRQDCAVAPQPVERGSAPVTRPVGRDRCCTLRHPTPTRLWPAAIGKRFVVRREAQVLTAGRYRLHPLGTGCDGEVRRSRDESVNAGTRSSVPN
ncbi:hypothetical protein [Streptomyces sp. NPDC088794]|uniref:hypothetical protein n=1 Tax=Streptomyces sp. NPDC088794 TaxID=3365902 RepID=UPI00382C2ECA